MKVKYCRVSTEGQTVSRQMLDSELYDKIYTENVSGSVVMEKRAVGFQLLTDIKSGKVKELVVEAVDRLGRDALDVMKTLRLCEDSGVNVSISNLGIQSIVDGKRSDMFSLVSGIVCSLAENERRNIAERCGMGRIAARNRGVKFGRKEGIVESDTKFLNKPKVKEIIKDLRNDYPYSVIAKNRGCSIGLVQKVNDRLRKIVKDGRVAVKKDNTDMGNSVPQKDYQYEEMEVSPIRGWETKLTKGTGKAIWNGKK